VDWATSIGCVRLLHNIEYCTNFCEMKRLIFILAALALLSSCKITRSNVRETYTERREQKTDIVEESLLSSTTIISEEVETDEYTEVTELITAVKLSPPDSLGNQYPTEITNTERKTTKGKKEQTKRQEEAQLEIKGSKVDNSTANTNISIEKVDKTVTKKKTPEWIMAIVIIACIAAVAALFIFLKKYRIL